MKDTLINSYFPRRVWEPTDEKNGKTLWSSRPVTQDDTERRREYLKKYFGEE